MSARLENIDRDTPMVLALLLYCYANGIMSSRKIETATRHLVPVRYLTRDTHVDTGGVWSRHILV